MRINLATDIKTRTGAPDKDARQKNSYIEVKNEQAIVRKRPSAQGGVSVGTGTAQGGYGTVLFWGDTAYTITEATGTDWSGATPYVIGDHVSVGFVDYWALADNTNSQPPSSNWSRSRVPPAVSPYSWTIGSVIETPDLTGDQTSVAWNGSVFCYLSLTSGFSYISANGLSWTSHAVPGAFTVGYSVSIIYNGNIFCAIYVDSNSNGGVPITSIDGITWTAQATIGTGIAGAFHLITVGLIIYASDNIGGGVYRSTDNGVTWGYSAYPIQYNSYGLYPITWNGSVFCVVSDNTSNISQKSSDAITWTEVTLPITNTFNSISSLGSVICAVDGSHILRSADNGVTWSSSTNSNAGKISSNNSLFLIFSGANRTLYYSSVDGITWTERNMPSSKYWYLSAYAGNKFIVFDSNTTACATSSTGL